MSFEYDPVAILQLEILKTQEAKTKMRNNKKKGEVRIKDNFIHDDSDQEFIEEYINSNGYYVECD